MIDSYNYFDEDDAVFFRDSLLCWFNENRRNYPWRKKSATNYQRIVAEILLKRTTAKAASELFIDFIKKYPSWKSLSIATEPELQEEFKPIGLWKQRARDIKKLSQILAASNGKFPRTKKEILKLPGVGQYVANAVLLFCYKEKVPLLDSNMARVLQRFYGYKKQKTSINKMVMELAGLALDVDDPVSLNWAIIDFSALICYYQQPRCFGCDLHIRCKYYGDESIDKIY
jgi:A/G-specific adenine glycosylase